MGDLTKRGDDLPISRSDRSVASRRTIQIGTLGRHDLAYTETDTTSWGNWPEDVLKKLRDAHLAPTRLDVGIAGELKARRQPSGLYYQAREGWYLGTDLRGRLVFVIITAKQPMEKLQGPGIRLKASGAWSVETRVWPLKNGKRINWQDVSDPSVTSGMGSVSDATSSAETRSLSMSDDFKRVLKGIPEEMQRAVIDGISYDPRPWGTAMAWGYGHDGRCNHPNSCEDVALAVVSPRVVLVLDVHKWPGNLWRGWAQRWEATEEPRVNDRPAVDRQRSAEVSKF